MEALLEREADVENWNDERMDELSRRVDESAKETREEMRSGFKEMREGFTRLEQEMKAGFKTIDERFQRVDRTLAGMATRKELQALDDRLFTLICALIVVIGGIIGTLIVING